MAEIAVSPRIIFAGSSDILGSLGNHTLYVHSEAIPQLDLVPELFRPGCMKILKISFAIVAMIAATGLNSVRADQLHMRAALEHLRAARAELQSAEHNKGGWRVHALEHVNRAIADTERGIAFAR
jgi:hypothetical protein